jgi:hypothetical protein
MTHKELSLVIAYFPEWAAAIRRLCLADSSFHELCADFALACLTLKGFEDRADAATRPEIAEYRDIIRELAADIETYLRRIERQAQGGATP